MRRAPAALLSVLCLLVPAAAAPAAPALSARQVAERLDRELRPFGARAGALAVDLTTGRRLYARRETMARPPASVNKLFTSAAALLRLGPEATLSTRVLALAPPDEEGEVDGHLYLVGGGDPTLGPAGLRELALALRAAGVRSVTGRVVGDGSRFDAVRGTPYSGWRASWANGGQLAALVYRRGWTGRRFAADPARTAADALARQLRARDVDVPRQGRSGRAPEGARELARLESAPLAQLVGAMNRPSDNFIAEMLLKAVGATRAVPASTAGGAAVARSALAPLGLRPRMVDGSGLSRGDQTTPSQVVALLQRLDGSDHGPVLERSLAVAGRSGTLARRMRGTPAAGRCAAKTGTLSDVSSLAGVCTTAGGGRVAFAWLMSRVWLPGARRAQDRMTAALARYAPSPGR